MALTDIDGGRLADNAFSLGKNLIINGAMQVAQRGTTSTASNYGTVDRFFTSFSGGAVTTTQESLTSGDPYDAGFRNFARLTNTTTATGAANYRLLVQNIEAQNVANSGWNYASATSYVTLSFWIRSSVSQAFSVRLRSLDGTSQNYPMSTGTLTADTWTKVTKTIPGNSNITVDNDNGAGLRVEFGAFWGTDSTDSGVTLDAWAAYSSSTRTTDMTNTWAGTTNATFDITGVQLEVGSVATPFEHRSYGDELRRCQRYFFNIPPGVSENFAFTGFAGSTTVSILFVEYPERMRDAPTLSNSGSWEVIDGAAHAVTAFATVNASVRSLRISATSSGLTQGRGNILRNNADTTAELSFSAEL